MTNEELCLRYQSGDAKAADELISRNMRFIRTLALRYNYGFHNASMDADDYMQEGSAALLRAAGQYDPTKQVQFISYAGQAVRNAILDAIRANFPNTALTALDDEQFGAISENGTDTDPFWGRRKYQLPSTYETDPEHIYIRKEQLEELYAAIHALSPRHYAWVMCRYGFDDDAYKSLAEMGRIYHLSECRANKTEEEAIGKLRKRMLI